MNKFIACGRTDVGLKRQRNEDSYILESDYGLFILADGMGGHIGGDVASNMAIETASNFIKNALSDNDITWPFGLDDSLPRELNAISSGIRLANRHIFTGNRERGTTIVVLLLSNEKAYICHVGDSRLYRIRDNKMKQLTEDHSLVAEEVKRGTINKEKARLHPLRHVITKTIGMNEDVKCDCIVENIINKDMFLLCSDGLSDMLDDSEILSIIIEERDIENSCERLILTANEKGGDDNITIILVRCR